MTRATQPRTSASTRGERVKSLVRTQGTKLELIRAYGQFWRADQIDWVGRRDSGDALPRFALLGRLGDLGRKTTLVADFRDQRGIYILYGDYGPYYVGVTIDRGLGVRLREHLKDEHRGLWDRFSWFGFRGVDPPLKNPGLSTLASLEMSSTATVMRGSVISQMESLLIHAMGPRNLHKDPGSLVSDEWIQIRLVERESANHLRIT
jgi:hypothetical protein